MSHFDFYNETGVSLDNSNSICDVNKSNSTTNPFDFGFMQMNIKASHIVIIDDDAEMRSLLSDFFKRENGHTISEFSSPQPALEFLFSRSVENQPDVDLVITDLNMPGMTGLDFIRAFKPRHPTIPIVLITAFGSIETAIEAIKVGAYDYITKPFKLAEVSATVSRALHLRRLQKDNQILRQEIQRSHSFRGIIGKSQPMLEVFDLIGRVSQATANILISGESGTGKEQVARAIHENGPRSGKRFVAINCTAIPDTLLESELFGHAKGSFTGAVQRKRGLFEEAEGGTLFLDEIGDMDMALQAKLLRVIQERKIRSVGDNVDRDIDVRIIAATHKDLKAAIKNNGFREDLYYRLSVIPIVIPPLRHRREDIPLLAEYFLEKFSAANGSRVTGFEQGAMSKLMHLPWEGNVRELENIIERAVVLCRGALIQESDLPTSANENPDVFLGEVIQQMPTFEDLEKRYMKFVLDKTGGKKERAAQILGINRRTLYRKEREYGFVDAGSDAAFEDENHD
jgi:two-component system response regulator HydG